MSVINFPTTVSGLNTIVNGTSALALDSVSAYETAIGAGEIVQFNSGLSAVASTVQGETAMVAMTPELAETGALSLGTAGTVASLTPLQVFGACAAAFGIGFTGGVGIAEVVDELDPNFWYNFYSGLNEKFGKVKAVVKEGISYLPLDVLDWVRQYFQDNNVFDTSGVTFYNVKVGENKIESLFDYSYIFTQSEKIAKVKNNTAQNLLNSALSSGYDIPTISQNDLVIWGESYVSNNNIVGNLIICRNVLNITFDSTSKSTLPLVNSTGKVVYPSYDAWEITRNSSGRITVNHITGGYSDSSINVKSNYIWNYGTLIPSVPGIEKNPDEVQPKPETLPQPETYPNWNPIQIPTVVPDASPLPEIPYYPVKIPEPDVQPNQQEAQNGAIDDDVVPETAKAGIDDAVDAGLNNPEPKPPVTPTPILPIVPPSTSPIGLHALYIPSATQLQDFNDYLWGNDFFDNVKKLFQDPMQGIISLHKVYFSPTITGTTSIVIGKQNTGVNSNYTETQYYEIDCGTVRIDEFFHDVRDYKGYTSIQLYLPFIGIEEVNVNDLMNKNVNITYKIDILTGNCVAIISAETFSGVNQILYIFNGNCGETVPISGSNYSSILMSSLSVVGAVVGTVASDGLLAPTLLSSGASLGKQLGHTIQRSGSIGGNFGALSPKKPYIIINRSVAYDAYNYQDLYGFPANKTISLGVCSGYTRVKSVHVEGIVCTDEEKDMIEQQLMKGVIV